MYRRDFLKLLAAVLAAPELVLAAASRAARPFDDKQEAAVAAVLDELWPGCLQADALKVMRGWLSERAHRRALAYFKSELAGFDSDCSKRFGKPFAELGSPRRAEMLDRLFEERKDLYQLFSSAALLAVFGPGSYGGNPGRRSWRRIGYSPGSQLPFPSLEY